MQNLKTLQLYCITPTDKKIYDKIIAKISSMKLEHVDIIIFKSKENFSLVNVRDKLINAFRNDGIIIRKLK